MRHFLGAVLACVVAVTGCLDFRVVPGDLACSTAVSPPCPGDWVCLVSPGGGSVGRCHPRGTVAGPDGGDAGDAMGGDANDAMGGDAMGGDLGGDAWAGDAWVSDTGPVVPGFGGPCDPAVNPSTCPSQMACIGPKAGKGFCSVSCETFKQQCDGVPPGTVAGCVYITPASNLYCAFLCRVKDTDGNTHAFDCPGQLVCSQVEDPPGQRSCVPP